MTTAQELRHTADRLLELSEEGDLDAVLALADRLDAAAQDHDDEVARESLFVARFQRAVALTERQEFEAAASAYRAAADTPTDLGDPDQRHEVAMALLNAGLCLDAVGQTDAALTTYDDVIARFGTAEDPVTRDQVVRARVNRAAALLGEGHPDAAREEADRVRAALDVRAPLDAEQWLLAGRIRAAAFVALGEPALAHATLVEAVALESDDPAVTEQRELAAQDLAELA